MTYPPRTAPVECDGHARRLGHRVLSPASSLRSPAVVAVLERLRRLGVAEDEPGKRRLQAREAELGAKVYGAARAALYSGAPIAVASEVGELLYVLAVGRRARRIVEFGTSLGVSTIHLAAAVRDLGAGSVVTTELQPEKAACARLNLAEAGLDDLVEIREGDALETLRGGGGIDLLFLDGWNDLYLPVLRLLEPRLGAGALVVADMSPDDPHLLAYREYVAAPGGGYASIEVPLDDGVVLSARTGG
ncbi:MAG: O-methyltransferase [Solirubrobacteraceae bacterium]